MNKILALVLFLLLIGCQSTSQDINHKYPNTTTTNKNDVQPKPAKTHHSHKLHINVVPADAQIYITNIKPKFAQGIELPNGEYKIKIKKQGFKTVLQTVRLTSSDQDKTLNITLKQDQLAFNSKNRVRKLTQMEPRSYKADVKALFGKKSSSLALASLVEWHNGELVHEFEGRYANSYTLDIKSGLMAPAYKGLKKDLSYDKKLKIVKKYDQALFQRIQNLRTQAREFLNTEYIIQVRHGLTEEEVVAAHDDEDETFATSIKWTASFYDSDDKNYIKGNKVDLLDLHKLKRELKSDDYGVWNFVWDFSYRGRMSEKDLLIKHIPRKKIISLWKNMPSSRYGRNEKYFDLEVLTRISDVYLDSGSEIVFKFEPIEIRVKDLDIKQKL
jgi:hypothetical protein